jgi:uncharacterized membrane protein YphA (DoxX/SURF4 family)
MTSTWLAAIAAAVVGLVFLVSGVAKLASPDTWRRQASSLSTPRAVVGCLPFVEVALGALLVAQVARRPLAIVAALVLAVFAAALAAQLVRGRRPVCACFGGLSSRPISWWSVLRNVALIGVAVVAAFAA